MNKIEKKNWLPVSKNSETYRRIQYSLKLSLRMLNGRFDQFTVQQVNSSSLSFDQKYKDKIALECWYRPQNDDHDYVLQHSCLDITPAKPRLFTAGTIIEKPEDLQENQLYTFYLFKVVVGKSYCTKAIHPEDYANSRPFESLNYDSIYLENDPQCKINLFLTSPWQRTYSSTST